MKKYIKYLIGIAFFVGLCANGLSANSSKVYATNEIIKDPDILPPTASISIENAMDIDGVYYISFKDITLNITASDNRTKSGDLLMIVSGDKLTETEMMNDKIWEPYAPEKDFSINTEVGKSNYIYLYLKDEAGNVSNSSLISFRRTYTVTYSRRWL